MHFFIDFADRIQQLWVDPCLNPEDLERLSVIEVVFRTTARCKLISVLCCSISVFEVVFRTTAGLNINIVVCWNMEHFAFFTVSSTCRLAKAPEGSYLINIILLMYQIWRCFTLNVLKLYCIFFTFNVFFIRFSRDEFTLVHHGS